MAEANPFEPQIEAGGSKACITLTWFRFSQRGDSTVHSTPLKQQFEQILFWSWVESLLVDESCAPLSFAMRLHVTQQHMPGQR